MNKKPEVATEEGSQLVIPICDDELQIIYKHGKPKGIRDRGGFLFFFPTVSKYTGQEERYRQEINQQYALADYLLNSLIETLTARITGMRKTEETTVYIFASNYPQKFISCLIKPLEDEHGKVTTHAFGDPGGGYDTLCGIDIDDPSIGHYPAKTPNGKKIDCCQCKNLFDRFKNFRESDFAI